jgi:hypothetical protein
MTLTWPLIALLTCATVVAGAKPDARPKRESIEWCNIWVPDATETELPRVLLIGDSISMGYYDGVQATLNGRAYVARMSTSSAVGDRALLDQVGMTLNHYRFDVIHFNIGLHGMGYTEAEYRAHFPELVRLIKRKAPGAKLIWATTTPHRMAAPDTNRFHANNERVKGRNQLASELIASLGIATDDLYGLVEKHPEYWSADGVHFDAQGREVEAAHVAANIMPLLPPKPRRAERS